MEESRSSQEISEERILELRNRHTLLPTLDSDAARKKYVEQVRKRVRAILLDGQDVTDDLIISAIKDPPNRRGHGSKRTGKPGAAEGRFRPK